MKTIHRSPGEDICVLLCISLFLFMNFQQIIISTCLFQHEICVVLLGRSSCVVCQVRECGNAASWRTRPRSHWGLLQFILECGHVVSPLFNAPGVTMSIFRVDWLHAADQGVTADFLGNLLILLSTKCTGNNHQERVADLWGKIQSWYSENNIEDRLQNLVDTMLKQPKKAPKLRASAAHCRALVPFAQQEANRLLDDSQPEEAAAKIAMFHLSQCYRALGSDSMFAADVLREHSTKFALQFVALERYAGDSKGWRVKPKLHLFLHLCSDGCRPATFWTYRDEDYGGSVSSRSRRRGGLLSAPAFSRNLLERFRMQPMIRMRDS